MLSAGYNIPALKFILNKQMKKTLIVSLLAMSALMGYSQTNTTTSTNTVAPIVGGIEQLLNLTSLTGPTNLVAGIYGSAALVNNNTSLANYSLGGAAAWNFNQNVGVGGAIDYVPDSKQFTLVTANVTLKLPIKPWPTTYPNFVLTPYGFAGAGTPVQGAGTGNGCLETTTGIGVAASIPLGKGWSAGLSAAFANWSGECLASGNRIYFALGIGKIF